MKYYEVEALNTVATVISVILILILLATILTATVMLNRQTSVENGQEPQPNGVMK